MIVIKNYYAQLSELRIAETRLTTLLETKALIECKMLAITKELKEVPIYGSGQNDKMSSYVIKCEEINKQIEDIEEEIRVLKKGLHKMDDILKHINGIEERVFRLYYIEGKTPTQISFIIPCSIATFYRYKTKIEKKFKDEKK